MPRFIGVNDVNLINHFATETVDKVVDTRVLMYKVNKENTLYNVYGEVDDNSSISFDAPIQVPVLINKTDQDTIYDGNIDRNQNIRFSFRRLSLAKLNIYPEEGDVLFFFNAYFQINSIIENQLIAGQPQFLNNMSIIVETSMVPRNDLGIEEDV